MAVTPLGLFSPDDSELSSPPSLHPPLEDLFVNGHKVNENIPPGCCHQPLATISEDLPDQADSPHSSHLVVRQPACPYVFHPYAKGTGGAAARRPVMHHNGCQGEQWAYQRAIR